MKQYLRQLLGESAVYGISGVVTSLIGMILVPIYTRTFEPAEYGVISVINTTNALLGMLLVCGLDAAASAWFWDKTDDSERRKTFSSWFAFTLLAGGLTAAIVVLGARILSRVVFDSTDYAVPWALFGGTLFFASFNKIANIWFRSMRKPGYAVGYSLFVSVTTTALTLLLVVKMRLGLVGVYGAQLVASAAGFTLLIALLRSAVSLRAASWVRLREMLVFALPLVPAAASFWLMNSASSYFLNGYCPREEVGLYQVGATVAAVLGLFTMAFIQAWGPFALSIARRPIGNELLAIIGELFAVGGLFVALCLSLSAPVLLRVFATAKYAGARTIVALLAMNAIILGIPQVISIPFAIVKKNGPYAKAVGVGALLTVPLFLILVPRYGKNGAALAVLAGNGLVPFYLLREAQRVYPLPYAFGRAIRSFLVIGTAIVVDVALDASVDRVTAVGTWPRKAALLAATVLVLALSYRPVARKLLAPNADAVRPQN